MINIGQRVVCELAGVETENYSTKHDGLSFVIYEQLIYFKFRGGMNFRKKDNIFFKISYRLNDAFGTSSVDHAHSIFSTRSSPLQNTHDDMPNSLSKPSSAATILWVRSYPSSSRMGRTAESFTLTYIL